MILTKYYVHVQGSDDDSDQYFAGPFPTLEYAQDHIQETEFSFEPGYYWIYPVKPIDSGIVATTDEGNVCLSQQNS